ncbi:MAG: L-threonylcarbamoyladenylate synthase [Lachnospiraceae bacterium]|nr:L-threonylcarbamoyladenylate synthase [Lachnospiraceae bacterium]
MKTKIYEINGSPTDVEIIKEAGAVIRQGGLVAFPTETVYGLGGDALNAASAERIYAAKGRPADNPLIIHLYRVADIEVVADSVPEVFYRLAEKFWPGPLTMILKKSRRVPGSTTGGLETVAVRMPDHQTALSLIDAAGGFVAAPSANSSGRPSPTIGKYVIEDMNGRIEMILDGGATRLGLESTIVDLTGLSPEILRPGSVTKQMLDSIINATINITAEENNDNQPPRAPGMKYRHYAPKALMTIVKGPESDVIAYINKQITIDKNSGLITGVIAGGQTVEKYIADYVKCIGNRFDEEDIARNLYRILREFDDEITGVIYSEAFSEEGIGQAIMNRLMKAASYRVIEL